PITQLLSVDRPHFPWAKTGPLPLGSGGGGYCSGRSSDRSCLVRCISHSWTSSFSDGRCPLRRSPLGTAACPRLSPPEPGRRLGVPRVFSQGGSVTDQSCCPSGNTPAWKLVVPMSWRYVCDLAEVDS
ncbi:unnamed protein product, partial [Gulo gulo]